MGLLQVPTVGSEIVMIERQKKSYMRGACALCALMLIALIAAAVIKDRGAYALALHTEGNAAVNSISAASSIPPKSAIRKSDHENAKSGRGGDNKAVAACSDNKDYTSLIVTWDKSVGAAAFIRGKKLWVIFSEFADIKLQQTASANELPNSDISRLRNITQVNLDNNAQATFLVADIKEGRDVRVVLYKQNTTWIIQIYDRANNEIDATNTQDFSEMPIKVYPMSSPPAVQLKNIPDESGKIVSYVDPVVGDKLVVFPCVHTNVFISQNSEFVDFNFLTTAQGIVIKKLNENLRVKYEAGVLSITSAIGLNIAPKVYAKDQKTGKEGFFKLEQYATKNSILSLSGFQAKKSEFATQLNNFHQLIYNSKLSERATLWVNLAIFYLANGWYEEANVAIDVAISYNIKLLRNYNVVLVHAVAEFMHGEFEKANDILNSIKTEDVPVADREEINFWKNISAYKLADQSNIENRYEDIIASNAINIFKNYKNTFLQDYTLGVFKELGFILAKVNIRQKYVRKAAEVLDILSSLDLAQSDLNRFNYAIAGFYAQQGLMDKALHYFDECLKDVADDRMHSKCSLSKTKFMFSKKSITEDDYVDRLREVQLFWRGDKMELETLKLLGDVYYKRQDYADALRVWKNIVVNFSAYPASIRVANLMGTVFIEYFTKKNKTNVTPLQALSFFYEFQELNPVGSIGDDIVIKIAGYLIELDLLDKAGVLLEHQVQNRLFGGKKENAINNLAIVYIMNDMPGKAVQLIKSEGTDFNKVSESVIMRQRKYIYAKALLKDKQYSGVVKLLDRDYSINADEIKSDMYWQLKNWQDFNDFSEPYLYSIRYVSQILGEKDVTKVLKQGISYIHLRDRGLYNNFCLDFKNRLPAEPHEYVKMFHIMHQVVNLTGKDDVNGMQDIQELQKLVHTLNSVIQ
ncbi:conserved hypothetical protein [Alphaproteobacteria bacterium]